MKLSVDPENVKCTEVDALADDALVAEIANILDLDDSKRPAMQEMLKKLYDEFLSAYYDVGRSLPEHEECKALTQVYDDAYTLLKTLNSLFEHGNTDQRLAKSLKSLNNERHKIWDGLVKDKWNPNYHLRRLIADIVVAADNAADAPSKKKSVSELQEMITNETDTKKTEDLETELILAEMRDNHHPNRHEEYKKRVQSRKTPKDLPLRESIKLLKDFFDEHVSIPFTAGKYYPEIGFKSPAFYAVKTALAKIYPEVSDRKIASIMQEASSNDGYNFYPSDEKKTCSAD